MPASGGRTPDPAGDEATTTTRKPAAGSSSCRRRCFFFFIVVVNNSCNSVGKSTTTGRNNNQQQITYPQQMRKMRNGALLGGLIPRGRSPNDPLDYFQLFNNCTCFSEF